MADISAVQIKSIPHSDRRHMIVECTEEIDGLCEMLIEHCPLDSPEIRGVAIRIRDIAAVVMSIANDDGTPMVDMHKVVFGEWPDSETGSTT